MFSPGSAEKRWVRWETEQFLTASCARNIPTKKYQNLIIAFQVTVENVWDAFLGYSVVIGVRAHFWC